MRKVFYIILGTVGLIFGAIGAIVPLMPAFPFLLLAAYSFARSSEKLHTWFINTKLYKNNLESYVHSRSMTKSAKIRVMSIVTLTMMIGFTIMHQIPIGQLILFIVWIFHLFYFIFRIKTQEIEHQ